LAESKYVQAAIKVLELKKTALTPTEICRIAINEHFLAQFGKTPEATMRAQLQAAWRKGNKRLVKKGKRYELAKDSV
jgi:hypothetical protein